MNNIIIVATIIIISKLISCNNYYLLSQRQCSTVTINSYQNYFFSRDQLTKQKKNVTKTHLVAFFDCRSIIFGYYNVIIQLGCAYNTDDFYHTERIDPPGMEKVVYIVCAYIKRTPDICVAIRFT